jgi:hypothetical protein
MLDDPPKPHAEQSKMAPMIIIVSVPTALEVVYRTCLPSMLRILFNSFNRTLKRI